MRCGRLDTDWTGPRWTRSGSESRGTPSTASPYNDHISPIDTQAACISLLLETGLTTSLFMSKTLH